MTSIIANLTAEGFNCIIRRKVEDSVESVEFLADGDIDADGANGQNGQIAAYMADGKGSELLANGGMGLIGGRVVAVRPWYKDIVIQDENGEPLVLPNGVIPSKTAYRFKGKNLNDPEAYVDAETVPYICVPPVILQKTTGVVLGCYCKVAWKGNLVRAMVADVGPRNKIGEISIAAARALGMHSSPREGGVTSQSVEYIVYPGVPFVLNGTPLTLLRSNGTHVS